MGKGPIEIYLMVVVYYWRYGASNMALKVKKTLVFVLSLVNFFQILRADILRK